MVISESIRGLNTLFHNIHADAHQNNIRKSPEPFILDHYMGEFVLTLGSMCKMATITGAPILLETLIRQVFSRNLQSLLYFIGLFL